MVLVNRTEIDRDALETGFLYSPFIAMGAGALLAIAAFNISNYPKDGSKVYATDPFPDGWGRGWGRYRSKMSSAVFLLVLGFFSPLMFMDEAIFEITHVKKGVVETETLLIETGGATLEELAMYFRNDTCGTLNDAVHGSTSVPVTLSDGSRNGSDVPFWSCECEPVKIELPCTQLGLHGCALTGSVSISPPPSSIYLHGTLLALR